MSTTTIILVAILLLPGREMIQHEQKVESQSLCWDMAHELVARAEEGPLRHLGGKFVAGCRVEVQPSLEH
jgi:hypothetical protein